MAMDKEEKDQLVLLLALCKLMNVDTFAGAGYGALADARVKVEVFDQATDTNWPEDRQ